MSTPSTKTIYFLTVFRSHLDSYSEKSGFEIVQELEGPEIPADLSQGGHYQVIKIERRFVIDAIVNYRTTEVKIS